MGRSRAAALACFGGGIGLLFACASEPADDLPVSDDPVTGAHAPSRDASTLTPIVVNDDAGDFGANERPSSSGLISFRDAGVPATKTFCAGGVGPGDLAIVELLIASRSGSGDGAEWVEIQSTRDCWLHVDGVTVSSPRGTTGVNAVTIDALELAPGGTFVVAGTADPSVNHRLPGTVFAWNATDVLKNDGDAVVVTLGAVTIDRLAYPAFKDLPVGRALSFPADCAWSDRADWQRWSLAYTAYQPGFDGTPNAPNSDVSCF